jgi:hypothetical protein
MSGGTPATDVEIQFSKVQLLPPLTSESSESESDIPGLLAPLAALGDKDHGGGRGGAGF